MKKNFHRLFVILLSMALRVFWLMRFTPDPIAPVDAEGYHLLAVNVLAGRGFAIGWDPPFCPTAIRPPLYPIFLMGSYLLLGVNPQATVLLQVLLEALTTACVMCLGDTVQEHVRGGRGLLTEAPASEARRKVGTLAGLLYALNGSTQRYVGFLFAEMLLLPLMTLALWATVRMISYQHPARCRIKHRQRTAWNWPVLPAAAGALWGLALLTKPNMQFLVLGMGLLLMVNSLSNPGSSSGLVDNGASNVTSLILNSQLSVLIFVGILGLIISPWLIRNRFILDRWVLSTAFEENLARVSAVATLAEVRDIRAEPWTETWEYLYDQIAMTAATQYSGETSQDNLPYCVRQARHHRQIVAVARGIVTHYPGAFLTSHLRGVGLSLLDPGHRLWYKALTGRGWETTGVVENIWVRVAWSLKRRAVGDALRALWLERVTRPPLAATLLWWGLGLARCGVGWLSVRGLWRLRRNLPTLFVLAGTVIYALALAGPITHDRFYLPAVPVVVTLVALGVRST